jgi:hypothetical protein
MNVEQYIRQIDDLYNELKPRRTSRVSVEWGKPSRQINILLREKLRDELISENEKIQWLYAFVYWTIKSQMLELHHKSKLFGATKKKRLAREAFKIRGYALDPSNKKIDADGYGTLVSKALNV